MKTIKCWGLKQDIKYHLYQYPIEVLRMTIGFIIAKKNNLLEGYTLRDYIEIAASRADMKCGRVWRVVFNES